MKGARQIVSNKSLGNHRADRRGVGASYLQDIANGDDPRSGDGRGRGKRTIGFSGRLAVEDDETAAAHVFLANQIEARFSLLVRRDDDVLEQVTEARLHRA